MNISYFYTLRNNMYLIFFKYLNTHFYLCYQYYFNQFYLSIFFLFGFTKYGTCTFYSINVLSYNVVYIYFKIQDALYEYNVVKCICMICPTLIFLHSIHKMSGILFNKASIISLRIFYDISGTS